MSISGAFAVNSTGSAISFPDYSPQIALIVHEDRFLCGGMDRKRVGFSSRKGFAACGADYGQYFPEDVLDNPPQSVKLFPNGAGNNHDVV